MEYFCVLVATVKSLIFCTEIETKINSSSVKESAKDEIKTFFLKSDIYDRFYLVLACEHSQIIILHTSYITQVYTLSFYKIHCGF